MASSSVATTPGFTFIISQQGARVGDIGVAPVVAKVKEPQEIVNSIDEGDFMSILETEINNILTKQKKIEYYEEIIGSINTKIALLEEEEKILKYENIIGSINVNILLMED